MSSDHSAPGESNFWGPAQLLFYRYIARKLPARWFRPELPDIKPINQEKRLSLEIVSHCWQYANLLDYQLSSYVLNPPKNVDIVVTVFHSHEDERTLRSLDYFSKIDAEGVNWNWQALPKQELFRRAIGRNKAALATGADWVWYADCDLIYTAGVLDSIAAELRNSSELLHFPGYEHISGLLPTGDKTLRENEAPALVDINTDQFARREINRAVGAFQIVRGDLLREIGYCNSIKLFQQPTDRWQKTYEDTIFRWLIGSEGLKLTSGGTYRIRHQEKGRYNPDSVLSELRKSLRAKQRYH